MKLWLIKSPDFYTKSVSRGSSPSLKDKAKDDVVKNNGKNFKDIMDDIVKNQQVVGGDAR